ncbi:hypothetical protein CROQUDRAFT_44583 [Cronartium quercuum f. sp. fusiforme G11]|uniref:J domain-containing protein n=1 Tax=Cronartium quercuum f. sp. fusiforme G11 TaxID=708437 RepID=A0A9P6NIN1_9BASI|nr:hypothetical protein CROQUDRAFT_44583 [Cronartium quercuum f. sp. fusiforme G11]
MKDDDETFSSFPNSIELIVATSKSLYTNYLPINELNLIAGHLAYQEADYVRAITCYTNVIELISKSSKSLPPLMIESIGIALSCRASSKLQLEDLVGAIPDLEFAIEAQLILKKIVEHRHRFSFSTRFSILLSFQLIRCYLIQLDLKSANRTWLKISENVDRYEFEKDPRLTQDAKTLELGLNWLMIIEKKVDILRYDQKWDQVIYWIDKVRNQGQSWGLDWYFNLPSDWSRWKAEAKAWLGFPEEAEMIIGNHFDLRSFDSPKDLWIQSLIAYAYGHLHSAGEKLNELYRITGGQLYMKIARRLLHLDCQIKEIQNMSKQISEQVISRMSSLVTILLNDLKSQEIERSCRQKIRMIYIETCASIALKFEKGPRSDHSIGEVIRHVNEMLTIEITHEERNEEERLPKRLKCLVMRCLLAKGRACFMRKVTLLQSKQAYEELSQLFSRGWICDQVCWMKVKSEYDELNKKMLQEMMNCEQNKNKIRIEIGDVNGGIIRRKEILRRNFENVLRNSKLEFGYYQVLGVTPVASQREIKIAFQKLALEHHPDKGGMTAHFQLLFQIYSTLMDRFKRMNYDLESKKNQLRRRTNF